MKYALYSLLALLAGLVLWGTVIEPRFLLDEAEVEAEVPFLPPSWDGQTVALLSDFQVGMWGGNVAMAQEAVETAIARGVSAALFAGDFVYSPDSSEVDRAVGIVRAFQEAGIPFVAVLGNHDYSLMDQSSEVDEATLSYLTAELRAAGATLLENEAVPLARGGDTLWVAGIGSVWAEKSEPASAMAGVPPEAARLVLMHNPESYRELRAGEAPLALAGHTHGGQIRLIPGRSDSWLDIVREGEVIADGWALDSLGAAGNRLYVTRGIGFSGAPVRINCRPELTLVTLRAARGDLPLRGPDA
ncbi:metallophosphoesterase [Rubricoccus marinus]|uniref:Calcineurin-like phosphoesterase domain-containing protein n=1 Tax=Rubricoccus marinus TaxID=716817 RepID=A0A259TW84_9BACT|nr:metallophosphoesterase [Rubricoccus marinus]OZC01981.1 hypothetical protein BSZ36_02685 [Rubricoccus marinus]